MVGEMHYMQDNFFIFTEAYNCSDVLKHCLNSFYKYHDDSIHVFCTLQDLEEIKQYKKIIPIIINPGSFIDLAYTRGHLGTAAIFADAILRYSGNNSNIIHFDSDLIFKQECLSNIKNKFNEGYDLIGPARPYKFNQNNRDDIRHMEDVVATCFFGFNKTKIKITDYQELTYSINARPFKGTDILDFFDYISFHILENGGNKYILDFDHTGGSNINGSRTNKYGELNADIDCGDWYMHFAGIGSGAKIFKKGFENTHQGYALWALKRYALYKKLFDGVIIPNVQIDEDKYTSYKNNLKFT